MNVEDSFLPSQEADNNITLQSSTPEHQLPQSEAAVGNQPLLKSLNVEDTSLRSQEADNYKRGDRVFIEKGGQTTKAMVCEITPQKKRVKVAVNPKEPPFFVEITSLCDPDPQVLNGLTFFPKQKPKTTHSSYCSEWWEGVYKGCGTSC